MGLRTGFIAFAALLLLAAGGGPVGADVEDRLDLGYYTLCTEIPFGPPEALGERIRSVRYPAEAPVDATEIEVWLLRTDRSDVERMQRSGIAPNVLAKTALGVQGQPEEINKTLFMGATAARAVYRVETPRPHELHLFQGIDPDGHHLSVLVKLFDEEASDGHAERASDLLRAIANDLQTK